MKYNISLPTALDDNVDRYNDNIDVIITLEDGISYVLVVATPMNLVVLMKKWGKTYFPPHCPFAFVEELTMDNIEKLVDEFCENDAYWLKYYHYAGSDKKIF